MILFAARYFSFALFVASFTVEANLEAQSAEVLIAALPDIAAIESKVMMPITFA